MSYAHMASGSAIASPPNDSTPARVASSSKVPGQSNDHARHSERLFIGPMIFAAAERNVEKNDAKKHWWLDRLDTASSGDDMDDKVPERHAFLYFRHRGGIEEDWKSQESLRKTVKQEILNKWRQSGWAFLKRRSGEARQRKWVGSTFKIGDDFLGLPMHTDGESSSSDQLSQPIASATHISASVSNPLSTQTYHSALQEPSVTRSPSPSSSGLRNNLGPKSNGSNVALIPSPKPLIPRGSTVLPGLLASTSLPGKAHTDTQGFLSSVRSGKVGRVASESNILSPFPIQSVLHHLRRDGGSKTVQFSAVPQSQIEPVSPSEVLARRSSSALHTSAGAAATQLPNRGMDAQGDVLTYGDVVRQERMLVRRSSVKSAAVSMYFDAEEAKKLRDFRSYEWKEFLVIWRKEQLELYENYSIPGKERFLGHKHKACVIPLQKPDTRLSLYSFVDLTFCLTCTTINVSKDKSRKATSLSVRTLFRKSMGTDVFVFKTKTRTSGIDWMWELWRQLGNEIPLTFEVHCPVLQSRVKLNIPEYDMSNGEGYNLFTKGYVVSLCQKALEGSPSWDYLINEPMRRGASLELCWRKGTMLDWIRWEMDVNGVRRGWAVLYGLCLGKPREVTHLEVRIGQHRPTKVTLEDGTHLCEPPAVEGYLYRVKPNSQNHTQVYLSAHGGCLFSIHPSYAYPPRPPIPVIEDMVESETNADKDTKRTSFKDGEIQRGARQVLQADTFIDMRSIAVVRRAFQQIFRPFEIYPTEDNPSSLSADAGRHVDGEDEGGEAVLAQHSDKATLRMRRSFELLMKTGNVVRFETYSCKVAQEWVEHLNQLIDYWTYRRRVDASHEMEFNRVIAGNPGPTITRPTEHTVRHQDYDEASEYLPSFWNWCVVDGCMSVVWNGRLFLRRNLRGQYKLMQIILVSGHLVQFHLTSHRASQHVRSQAISLLDAYVCSGHFATQSLPVDEFAAGREPVCRRFQDGLESEDHESDTIFLLWYRPHGTGNMNGNASKNVILPLNAKHRVLVLKARSKLERDAWCWALNTEIERLFRRTLTESSQRRA